jgi:hypothetical protein
MPKFIYTILILILVNLLSVIFLVTQTSPDSITTKLIFSILVTFILSFSIPLFFTLWSRFVNPKKEELNLIFKKSFKENLLFSFLIGLFIFLKTIDLIDISFIVVFFLGFIAFKYLLQIAKKPRKRVKY